MRLYVSHIKEPDPGRHPRPPDPAARIKRAYKLRQQPVATPGASTSRGSFLWRSRPLTISPVEIVAGRGIAATVARRRRHYIGRMYWPSAPLGWGQLLGARTEMDTDASTPKQKRLDIALRLYWALVAQNSDRQVTLCNGSGRVLARNERRPRDDAAEKAS